MSKPLRQHTREATLMPQTANTTEMSKATYPTRRGERPPGPPHRSKAADVRDTPAPRGQVHADAKAANRLHGGVDSHSGNATLRRSPNKAKPDIFIRACTA
ncbi:unnamed protein product, partial [Polarella glacialis]